METSVNNKCRAFTSLEQSKKLAEILSLESADMEYMFLKKDGSKVSNVPFVKDGFEEPECGYIFIPCWSLASLLGVLPEKYTELIKEGGMYRILIKDSYMTSLFDNLVDACYEMIIRLNELKLL